ncbi:Uncharacterised protein [Klebsiella pneumoniae]|nr:Uncharacterised protein [Klebsiella pneumoniae]
MLIIRPIKCRRDRAFCNIGRPLKNIFNDILLINRVVHRLSHPQIIEGGEGGIQHAVPDMWPGGFIELKAIIFGKQRNIIGRHFHNGINAPGEHFCHPGIGIGYGAKYHML